MGLTKLKSGEDGLVARLEGRGRFLNRVAAMGFTPGTPVRMIRNTGRGPVIVFLRETEVALGRKAAAGILLEGGR